MIWNGNWKGTIKMIDFDNTYSKFLLEKFDINKNAIDLVLECESLLDEEFKKIDEISNINQVKVLKAFQENRINDTHFSWNTGYGYDDSGRDAVERVYSSVFGTESSIVRSNIVNGTHAIAISLLGILRHGDELLYATGAPYDTLHKVIGNNSNLKGTFKDYGIAYRSIPLNENLDIDCDNVIKSINDKTKIIALQRSTGYDFRPAISIESIKNVIRIIKQKFPEKIIFVDNCYGEFVDTSEPTDFGADIMAGSLIKNPGGGLALSGGYITGKSNLINAISNRLTCPGIGMDCGLTFGQNRNVLQGLFLAPGVVNSALKNANLLSSVYKKIGFEVATEPFTKRSDIVVAIKFNNKEKMITFCQSIQSASPIDSFVSPIPWDMPGYNDQVVMASGSFVQGSSIELSADAPVREPYIGYFQGGLTYEHGKFGIIKSVSDMMYKGFI